MSENETNQQAQAPVEVSGEALANAVLDFFKRPGITNERDAFYARMKSDPKAMASLVGSLTYFTGLRTDGEFVAGIVSDFVNAGFRSNHQAFVDKVLNDHRTLQQSTMSLFLACIAGWAEANDKGWFDLRNEATVKLAKSIVEAHPNNFHDGQVSMPMI